MPREAACVVLLPCTWGNMPLGVYSTCHSYPPPRLTQHIFRVAGLTFFLWLQQGWYIKEGCSGGERKCVFRVYHSPCAPPLLFSISADYLCHSPAIIPDVHTDSTTWVQTIISRGGTQEGYYTRRACSSLRPCQHWFCSSPVVNEEACRTRRSVRVEWMTMITRIAYPSQGSNGDVA